MTATHPHRPGPAQRPKRRRAPWVIGAVVVLVAVVAVLAFGVFGVHTLFIDDEVDEAGPTFASGAVMPEADAGDGSAGGDPAVEGDPSAAGEGGAAVEVAGEGTFEGVDHAGEGTARILTDGEQAFVRFEDDFATDNGPDLYAVVYVGGERIELARLKGNRGAQNYEVPDGVDPAAIETVAVWCKRFDSTFTEAQV